MLIESGGAGRGGAKTSEDEALIRANTACINLGVRSSFLRERSEERMLLWEKKLTGWVVVIRGLELAERACDLPGPGDGFERSERERPIMESGRLRWETGSVPEGEIN